MNKKVVLIILALVLVIIISIVVVMANNSTITAIEENLTTENNNENIEGKVQDKEVEEINIKIGSEILKMKLEQNEATKSLVEKLKQGDITVNTSEYGSFEQVGDLGFCLPKNDKQIKTKVSIN